MFSSTGASAILGPGSGRPYGQSGTGSRRILACLTNLAKSRVSDYGAAMTKLEFTLQVSDRLAREAREAGLLAPAALADLLEAGVRQKAAERIQTARARSGGGKPMALKDLQAIVAEVRKTRA